MRLDPVRTFRRRARAWWLAALLVAPCGELAAEPAASGAKPPANAAPSTSQGTSDYRRKLEQYTKARQKYEEEANAYWTSIAEKRRARNGKRRNSEKILADDYVLTQPPVYSGPARPVDPASGVPETPPRKYVPVVADFLASAAEHFKFVPQRPQSEIEFKRAYAKVASAAGITKEQAVRIYGFESGGNGGYDVQAGLEHPRPGARAITTALGYNQLLNTNSVELMAEQGDHFIKALKAKAAGLAGESKTALERKIEVVQRMIEFSRSVPDDWNEHDRLANTPKGLGVHAMNLDLDVGPLLQTQKLLNSVAFARLKGYKTPLSAAELEMMNLTGDGNGFDMVTMPPAMREQVPTANFFQQASYWRNGVAVRNNVVAKLLAATNATMDQELKLQGAKDLAASF
jgi:hypothetical protein